MYIIICNWILLFLLLLVVVEFVLCVPSLLHFMECVCVCIPMKGWRKREKDEDRTGDREWERKAENDDGKELKLFSAKYKETYQQIHRVPHTYRSEYMHKNTQKWCKFYIYLGYDFYLDKKNYILIQAYKHHDLKIYNIMYQRLSVYKSDPGASDVGCHL